MKEVPSMWRVELLHPQFVHFTVALLFTGALCWLLSVILIKAWRPFFSKMGQFLIVLGTLLSWVAVYTGTLADSEVGRTLCDPTVLERHEGNAYITAYLFSGISLLFLLRWRTSWSARVKKTLTWLLAGLIVAGSIYLTYTAHMGAKVVYQQGGGVYHPSKDCEEFE